MLLCRDDDAAATREIDPEIIRDAGTIRLRYEVPVDRGDYHIVIGHPREVRNGRE